MKKQFATPLLLITLLAVYDLLFWNQKAGINLPVFILLLIAVLAYSFPNYKKVRNAIGMVALAAIAAVLVAITNTTLSKVTAFFMAGIMVAFVHQVSLRSVPYAVAYIILSLLHLPQKILRGVRDLIRQSPNVNKIFRYHKLAYFPATITLIFLIIYSIGDPQFASLLDSFIANFFDRLQWLAQYFTVTHFLFLLLGSLLITTALIPTDATALVEHELRQRDDLRRVRKKFMKPQPNTAFNYAAAFSRSQKLMTALKNEYRKGVLTLVMINLLLLCVNAIDIVKVWFEGQSMVSANTDWTSLSCMRSNAVHEGTYALILSILLAMGVLLFFFRGNLNFLRRNQLLRQLAYIWIFQNALLVITVVIRNYYYISDCGLTMKRIGVYAFLLATLFGLLTFFIKILRKKSSFYLVRVNCRAICIIFILLNCVDWDPYIAQYNITHIPAEKLDRRFLLRLSDHALPVLIQHREVFIHDNLTPEKSQMKQAMLKRRIDHFLSSYESHTWQSWNYAEYKVYRFLKSKNQAHE